MIRRVPTAILISGRGSNMSALIDAAQAPEFPAKIVLVLSDQRDAPGLALAEAAGVPIGFVDPKAWAGRDVYDAALEAELLTRGVELVCLAGFMRILKPPFVERWRGRILNIHPSLLPAYRGLHTHERALADGVTEHGCTVHWVTAELDAGEIIAQTRVPVLPDDDAETLRARVLLEEHRLYPRALRQVAEAIQGAMRG